MDVGNPSNFVRILELFDKDLKQIKSLIKGYSFTDDETRKTIKKVYEQHNYILDPHGAVAYLGLSKHLANNKAQGIFLETAHPAKFYNTVNNEISGTLIIPERLKIYLERKKKSIEIGNTLDDLKDILNKK